MNEQYVKFLLNKTRKNYNLIAKDYSRTRGKMWEELKFLKEYATNKDKILDLGCGNGRLYELFEEMPVDYYGIDISEKLIEIAKSRYPNTKFQVADALNLPFPDNFFNKIFSIAVFHHIPSEKFRLQFLKEAKRVLKPEGLLILTVWNIYQRKTAWKQIVKNVFLSTFALSKLDFGDVFIPWKNQSGKTVINRYFHHFSKRELKALAKKAGFEVKEIKIMEKITRNLPNKRSNILLIVEK